jgi:hypothetical protein
VKVCDICGDVGEEEKLAVCSRCNDGAEHVYGFVYFIAFFSIGHSWLIVIISPWLRSNYWFFDM